MVVACVLAGLWTRTLFFADQLSFSIGHRTHFVASCLNGLCVMSIDQSSAMAWRTVPADGFQPYESLAHNLSQQNVELIEMGVNPVCCYLLYWWLAVPLAVLSTYLILWKPRKRA
jgi:hypothetical protein